MPFVKLDTDILRSTLWYEPVQLKLFITALLMAEPREYLSPVPTLPIDSLEPAEFVVPAGWYGFVPAAGIGIVHQALMTPDEGIPALRSLGEPEASTRSQDFGGRRLVRIDGGFLVLNYMKYRDRDYTAAERSARYRVRKRTAELQRLTPEVGRDGHGVASTATHRDITQAEAEAEVQKQSTEAEVLTHVPPAAVVRRVDDGFDAFWNAYPKKVGKGAARVSWRKLVKSESAVKAILAGVERQKRSKQWLRDAGRYIPNPATWLNQQRWDDEPDPDVPYLSDRTIKLLSNDDTF